MKKLIENTIAMNNLTRRLTIYRENVIIELGHKYDMPREYALFISTEYPDTIHWGELFRWSAGECASNLFKKYKANEMDIQFTS